MVDNTCDHLNNWRWDNARAYGDQFDHSVPQNSSLGKVKHTMKHFSWYCCDDLRAKIMPPNCQQYKPGNFLAVRPQKWDEKIDEEDDEKNRVDSVVPSGERSRPVDGNDKDNGNGEKDTQGGAKGTGKGK
jgi:hypothetical protein